MNNVYAGSPTTVWIFLASNSILSNNILKAQQDDIFHPHKDEGYHPSKKENNFLEAKLGISAPAWSRRELIT